MAAIETDLHSVGDVSARLNCAPSTLRFWERRGEIPTAQRVGMAGVRLWKGSDVALIERRIAAKRAERVRGTGEAA